MEREEKIIDKNVKKFLERIYMLSDIGPFRKRRSAHADFNMFEPATPEYYEYKFFERSLESYIRENLVNMIIPQLFSIKGIRCELPNYGNSIYVDYSNESIEEVYPFEFIVDNHNNRIGYRYTGPCWKDQELKRILKKYRLKYVAVIDWSDAEAATSDKISWGISDRYRKLVLNISAKEFFSSYFSTDLYNLFFNKIKDAVKVANEAIGFTTIPSLSLSYLNKFKIKEMDYLSEIAYDNLVYEVTGRKSPIRNLVSNEDYRILNERFINQGLYKALVGSEDFAISFITSEYLYQTLKNGGKFDYTAVVCGYLKSIEQLLYKLLQITLEHKSSQKLMIRPENSGDAGIKDIRLKNPNNKKSWLIPFEERFKSYFDTTLGSMIWFINDNENGWYISKNGKNTVRRYLLNYNKEDRNGYFHKDNINSFNEVKRIRNNTIALMYYLIGGYRLTEELSKDKKLLRLYDDNFDRMYAKLIEVPRGRGFYLKFKNEEVVKAIRLYEQDRPMYDSCGSLKESSIRFVKVDNFDVDYEELLNNISDENEIVVNFDNTPERIWLSTYKGNRIPIEW